MARTLADAAIGDDRPIGRHPLRAIELLQFLGTLERPVVVARLCPGHVLRSRDVAAPLTGLREARRRENLAGELLWTADVDEHRSLIVHGPLNIGQKRAKRHVGRSGFVGCPSRARHVGRQLTAFLEPFLPSTVHDAHVGVAVDLELPECPRGEPVVVVAVEHHGGVVVDARTTEQLFEPAGRHDVADDGVAELGGPVPAARVGYMTLGVRAGVDIDLHDPNIRVGMVLQDPLGAHDHFGRARTPVTFGNPFGADLLVPQTAHATLEMTHAQMIRRGLPRVAGSGHGDS